MNDAIRRIVGVRLVAGAGLRLSVAQYERGSLPTTAAQGRRSCSHAPRRCSSNARCRTIRAPDIPSGWPMEMAPPLTLTFSGSRPRARVDLMPTAANASLISTRSNAAGSIPSIAARSRDRVGGVGSCKRRVRARDTAVRADLGDPGQSELDGLWPCSSRPRPRHRRSWSTHCPRQTVPSGRNAGRRRAGVRRWWCRHGFPSCVTSTGSPLRCGIETGTTSSSKMPVLPGRGSPPVRRGREFVLLGGTACSRYR